MKSIVVSAFFLFSSFLSAKAQPPIFKISGNGLSQPSYLFGTMHLVPKSDYQLPKNFKKLLSSCNTLAMEVDMTNMKDEVRSLAGSFMLPTGTTYESLMDSSQYAWFQKYLSDTLKLGGLKTNIYTRMKPIMLSSALLKEGIGKSKSYDEIIFKMGSKMKKSIYGFETLTDQMGFLDSISFEDQLQSLQPGMISSFMEMSACYKTGDLDSLMRFAKAETGNSEYKELEANLLDNRNPVWIPQIEKLIKKEPTMIAVGALHLPGDKGVIKLLQDLGYTVEKI